MSDEPALTRVVPAPSETIDPSTDAGLATLGQWYESSARVRLNMITSLTGAAAGSDGTSNTLTSRLDRTILGIIRGASDGIIVGAQTVRQERYLVPKSGVLAIVTRSGDLTGTPFADVPNDRVWLVCAENDRERVNAHSPHLKVVSPARGVALSPSAVVSTLTAQGLESLVVEGGSSTASQFLTAHMVDEACVTVAPAIVPAAAPFVSVAVQPRSTVISAAIDDAGFSFLRLSLAKH